MATHRSSKKSDQSESMIEADIANGEAPDTLQEDATESRRGNERTVAHPIGARQARENLDNDSPA